MVWVHDVLRPRDKEVDEASNKSTKDEFEIEA